MTREEALKEIKKLKAVNCFVAPTKGIDSGSYGKAFEGIIKLEIQGRIYTKHLVTPNKRAHDFTYKKDGFEVKTGGGPICYSQELDFSKWLANEYIVYQPKHGIEDTFVLRPKDFIDILKALNLIKQNKTKNQWNIQTFYNSAKKLALYDEMLRAKAIEIKTELKFDLE